MFASIAFFGDAQNPVPYDDRLDGNPASRQPQVEFLRPRSQSLASISLDGCRTVGIQFTYARTTTAKNPCLPPLVNFSLTT